MEQQELFELNAVLLAYNGEWMRVQACDDIVIDIVFQTLISVRRYRVKNYAIYSLDDTNFFSFSISSLDCRNN